MTDERRSTKSGSEPEADNESFLDWLAQVPDPRERYRRATEELERHQEAVERLSMLRAEAAADAYASGETIRSLAEELNVSPARMHQIIRTASPSAPGAPESKRRSRRPKGDKKT